MLSDISRRLVRREEEFSGLPGHEYQLQVYLQKEKRKLVSKVSFI